MCFSDDSFLLARFVSSMLSMNGSVDLAILMEMKPSMTVAVVPLKRSGRSRADLPLDLLAPDPSGYQSQVLFVL